MNLVFSRHVFIEFFIVFFTGNPNLTVVLGGQLSSIFKHLCWLSLAGLDLALLGASAQHNRDLHLHYNRATFEKVCLLSDDALALGQA